MKKYLRFLLILVFALLLMQCKTEDFEPIDIFIEEELPVDAAGNIKTDSSVINLGRSCDGTELFAYKDKVLQTITGFQVKGTIFTKSHLGLTALTSGDFEIKKEASGNMVSMNGFGSILPPKLGLLEDNLLFSDIFGASLSYGKGLEFRNDYPDLPLQDNNCYFRFNVDPAADFLPGKIGGPMMIGSTLINFKNMYLQADAPAILVKGDMYGFDKNAKPEALPEGAGKFKKFKAKAGKLSPKWSITNVSIGLSAEPHFVFRPSKFSDELEEIVGGTGFEEFKGSLYLKGTVPLKKYPIDVTGELVYDNSFSPRGAMDLFENGFEDAAYRLGFNGKVEFGHFLLDFLPLDLRVELGNATMQQNIELSESFLRVAGEYDSARLYDELLGPEIVKLLPTQTFSGKMYLNVGTELSEWEMYIENQLEINIPGVGRQPFQQSILHINNEKIEVQGLATLPWGIGQIQLKGLVQKDGTFSLRGKANAGVDFGKGVKLGSAIDVEISNRGVFLNGMLSLPGGVSDFAVEGELSSQRIKLKGSQRTNIKFGQGEALQTNLSLEANSDSGVFLKGFMKTPLQVAEVAVEGEISSRGLMLRGLIKGKVDFGVTKLQTDLSLAASTWGGAQLSGMIDVPLVIIGGNLSATGMIDSPTKFGLSAEAGVFIDFGVASARPNVVFGFSQSEVKIGANAEFCITEICATVGLLFNPNWQTGEVQICAELPVAGETCI